MTSSSSSSTHVDKSHSKPRDRKRSRSPESPEPEIPKTKKGKEVRRKKVKEVNPIQQNPEKEPEEEPAGITNKVDDIIDIIQDDGYKWDDEDILAAATVGTNSAVPMEVDSIPAVPVPSIP